MCSCWYAYMWVSASVYANVRVLVYVCKSVCVRAGMWDCVLWAFHYVATRGLNLNRALKLGC